VQNKFFQTPEADPELMKMLEPKEIGRMTREILFGLHNELCQNARATMQRKNADYAHESDVFRNFRMFGAFGILVRMSDKLSRLRTFEERNEFSVSDESLRDTIEDLINYAVILYAYKQESK
jgi:hypothetical protein